MSSTMAPFDQSRELWYDLPGEKRSNGYGSWLDLRDNNEGNGNGNQGNGGNKGERDGGDDSDDEGGGGKKGDGKKDKDASPNPNPNPNLSSPAAAAPTAAAIANANPNPISPAAATLTAAAIANPPPPPPAASPTFLPNNAPAIQPAAQPNPSPNPAPEPTQTPTTTEEPTTTAEPIPTTTTETPPETTTSTTSIIVVPSSTSSIPIATMTMTSPSSSLPISTSILTTTMSPSAVVTSITSTTTEFLVLTTSSSQRKGEKDHPHKNGTAAASALADTTGGNPTLPGLTEQHRDPPLSPTAEHALLIVGTIGGLILVGFLLYLFVRIRKIDVRGKFDDLLDRYPKLESMGSNIRIPAVFKRKPWSKRPSSPGWEKHDGDEYEPTITGQKSEEAFYLSNEKPAAAKPVATQFKSARSTMDFSEKTAVSYGMSTNPMAPLTITNPSAPSATMSFYGVQPPPNAYLPNPARMSELSSLSSGFGDAQIDVPESGPSSAHTGTLNSNTMGYGSTVDTNAATVNTLQPHRQSFMQRASRAFAEPLTSRFSWTVANKEDAPARGQRDTVYTTTSEDSAPRFRTIHSWVNQQTHRVERGRTVPVPSMPPLPPSQRHLRQDSEVSAFRQHPGDQVNIPEATRIESAILDRKLGGV